MDFATDLLNKLLNFVIGSGLFEGAAKILHQAFDSDILATLDNLSEAALPIASVLVCIYFTIALMDKIAADNFTTDQFITLLIKLVFSILIINNAQELAKIIMSFGEHLLGDVASSTEVEMSFADGFGFFEKIFAIILMLIPAIFSILVRLIMYFFTYGYAIEVYVRSAFAPIGLADLISGGINSNGYKYLRKMIAVALQGSIMLGILIVGSQLSTDIIQEVSSINSIGELVGKVIFSVGNEGVGMLQLIGVQLATVGLLGSARTIANDLIG